MERSTISRPMETPVEQAAMASTSCECVEKVASTGNFQPEFPLTIAGLGRCDSHFGQVGHCSRGFAALEVL